MAQTECGFNDTKDVLGSNLLALYGHTLIVDVGFDPKFNIVNPGTPIPGIRGIQALVDTGAGESCIDNLLASQLKFPIVDRRLISGSKGSLI